DVGGTFTDVIVWAPGAGGGLSSWKVPTTPADQSVGFATGLAEALSRAGAATASLVAHGTTVATNAVLERTGAVTALITTEGFADLLAIGRQNRPSLYDLWADRPAPLAEGARAVGVPERVGPAGEVVTPLDEAAATGILAGLLEQGIESAAVCLLFSFANPAHERRLRTLLAGLAPGLRVSLSSEVSPEFREYERASTTALDAYVGPVVERYLRRVAERAAATGAPVVVMRSGGATMSLEEAVREPVHTLLSGPAAGVRGAVVAAAEEGFGDLVTFDMGGTSTDVCLVEGGSPAVTSESSVGGLPFRTPAVAVHTVGAGGGSLLWLDPAGALRAGPASAGADPGPACYGRGGTAATVTDAHLVAGHLDPARFLGGRLALDAGAAQAVLAPLAGRLGVAVPAVAEAGLRAVEAQMAAAIRVVTVERGRDPRDFALVAFGGAGPMHACALADALEMPAVLIPPFAGALSALGLLASPRSVDAWRTRVMALDSDPGAAVALLVELRASAAAALARQGAEVAAVSYGIDCRYRGQAHEVPVPVGDACPAALESLGERFAAAHRARFGWDAGGDPVELVTFRVRVSGPDPGLQLPPLPPLPPSGLPRRAGGGYLREALGAGAAVDGPCLIWGEDSTTVVAGGWRATVGRVGTLILRRRGPGGPGGPGGERGEPARAARAAGPAGAGG
ncbi:MAG TPA: hydantoinase/oxoprolinase family protein, partial [Acidimicrobiia bacterium]|nr:hydantoinase/oxoprolinase family protein [Acidimicrobiia bacterium]